MHRHRPILRILTSLLYPYLGFVNQSIGLDWLIEDPGKRGSFAVTYVLNLLCTAYVEGERRRINERLRTGNGVG